MRNTLLVIAALAIGYAALESTLYLALSFGLALPAHPYYDLSAWSNPDFAAADPISGMLLRPKATNDGIRVVHGDVQFYFRDVTANSAGFHADRDYTFKKQRPYRMLVYGDSFTAMHYQRETWIDHVNQIYESRGIEIYNFSFNGGGLANWHRHYLHEVANRYEFDMVVFAICCGDLQRAFSIGETRPDGVYFNRFAEPPRDAEDMARNYLPHLVRLYPILDRQFLARLDSHFTRHSFLALPPDLYVLRSARLAMGATGGFTWPTLSTASLDRARREALIDEMVGDIQRRGKLAVLVLLPWDRQHLKEGFEKDAEEVRGLAARGCSPFINGYDFFRNLTSAEIDAYWPRYDAHWLKPGADRFGEMLVPELLRLRDEAAASHRAPCH